MNAGKRISRAPLLLLGIASLIAGVWGGLVRLPLNLPLPGGNANWLTFHGPLMVCGFLGTVIGLERAVGLKGLWAISINLAFTEYSANLRQLQRAFRPPPAQ
jgi:hypothetical protein